MKHEKKRNAPINSWAKWPFQEAQYGNDLGHSDFFDGNGGLKITVREGGGRGKVLPLGRLEQVHHGFSISTPLLEFNLYGGCRTSRAVIGKY